MFRNGTSFIREGGKSVEHIKIVAEEKIMGNLRKKGEVHAIRRTLGIG